jgi:hypothetical protein
LLFFSKAFLFFLYSIINIQGEAIMKKWSEELIELSREYLNYNGVNVKSLKPEFGILNIDYEKSIYTITLRKTNQTLTFNSVEEMINAGWAVD